MCVSGYEEKNDENKNNNNYYAILDEDQDKDECYHFALNSVMEVNCVGAGISRGSLTVMNSKP